MYIKLEFEKYKNFVDFQRGNEYNCDYIITTIKKIFLKMKGYFQELD